MLYPVWPASLTDADWQKKKGTIAKAAGKTGVGEAMKAGKTAFDKIDFNSQEASQILPGDRDEETLLAKKKNVEKWYRATVEPARDKIKDIIDAASKTAASWKKNKLIPNSSVKAAEKVEADADQLWIALKINSGVMTEIIEGYDKLIEQAKRTEQTERLKVDEAITNLKKALKEVTSNLTKKGWEDGTTSAHQRCRSMCNAIKGIPALKKQFFSEWSPYGNFYAKSIVDGSSTERAEVVTMVKNVAASLKTFENNYKKHL